MTAHAVATDQLQPGGVRRDGARLLVDHAISLLQVLPASCNLVPSCVTNQSQ